MKTHMNIRRYIFFSVIIIFTVFIFGCATTYNSLRDSESGGMVIIAAPESAVLSAAYEAISWKFPAAIINQFSGFQTGFSWFHIPFLDKTNFKFLLKKTRGINNEGKEVEGYTYAITTYGTQALAKERYVNPIVNKFKEILSERGIQNVYIMELGNKSELSVGESPFTEKTPMPKSLEAERNTYAIAVVIGNQNYANKDIPPVNYALNDASEIKQYLMVTLGYRDGNIIFETDTSKSTLEKIFGTDRIYRGMLYNYTKPGKSDVFIYYSGHGSPDPNTNEAYLVPTDCDPAMMGLTAYPLNVLYGNLQKIEAKSVTVVIDACFSGGTNTGKWIVPNASPALIKINNPITAQNNLTIFTSAENNQVSSWYPEKQHSMFTYFFLKAVTGDADFNKDNKITFQEIYNFVADKSEGVPYYAKRLHGGRIQTPTMHTANKDNVFVRY